MSTTFNPDEPLYEELEGPVEQIMAYLIDKFAPGIGSLYVPGNPDWGINPYKQERMPVWEALDRFAQMIGWEVRWKWLPGSRSTGQLTFSEPLRDPSSAVVTLTPDHYQELTVHQQKTDDIRNRVYVTCGPVDNRQIVMMENPTSIDFYRFPRVMWIEESSDSPLQTSLEAQRLARAALMDLSFPEVRLSMRLPYCPVFELGDYVEVIANGESVKSSGLYHVASIKHDFGDGSAMTDLSLVAGAATASRGKWKGGETRRGVKYL